MLSAGRYAASSPPCARSHGRESAAGPVRREQPPERLRVVGDAQVAELVADDVVEHPGRREQEAPRERQRPARRARAPARALVAHRERRRRDADARVPGARSRPRARRAPRCGTSARAPPPRPRRRVRAARAPRRSSSALKRFAVTTPQRRRPRRRARRRPHAPGRAHRAAGARARARARARASSMRCRSLSLPCEPGRPARGRLRGRARAGDGGHATNAAAAPSPLRCAGAPCARPPRQADYSPCWRSRSPSRLRCTGKVRAGSSARASSPGSTCWRGACSRRRAATGETRVIDVPGPVAALVRPRVAGGLVVATETGVVLLDEHDAGHAPVRDPATSPVSA